MKAPVLDARVLVIDDDEAFLAALQPALEESFSAVDCAPGEEEARSLLARRRYDLILLDVLLGNEPAGLGLCRALRAEPRWRDVPVLVVTAVDAMYGMNLKSYVGEDQCLPADAFIDKGAGVEEILKRARSVVERPAGSKKPSRGNPSGTRGNAGR